MVLQGHESTLPVTLEDIVYHMHCVQAGNRGSLIMADLPFMSYAHEHQALDSAAALMRAGPHGQARRRGLAGRGRRELLAERGIPVVLTWVLRPSRSIVLAAIACKGAIRTRPR